MSNAWVRLPIAPAFVLLLALRAERLYRQMPPLPKVVDTASLPSLSIIVPARNEAENLRRLLPSLSAIRYSGSCEVIVVDDNSMDETAQVAKTYGACVLRIGEPPAGWLGKPHALHQGASAATGEWLLFTDADTVHAPNGPASAVHYAVQQKLDGLSLFPAHENAGWTDRLALQVAYLGLFAGLSAIDGLLNGQYVLLRRDVYENSGGFAAVCAEKMDDLALGRRLHRLGYRVPALVGERAVSVRMYRDIAQLWAGLTRLGANVPQWTGPGALVVAVFTAATAAPVLTMGTSLLRGQQCGRAMAAWLLTVAGVLPWSRHSGLGLWVLLAPVGAAVVQVAAIWGFIRRVLGRGVSWKGRRV